MSNYRRPTTAPISDTWQGHKSRNPPSSEPGTDYECPYGTDLEMAEAGVVSVVDRDPGGGEGRRLSIDLDDGRRVSYIHLDSIAGSVGMRVARGQRGVCLSGASGFGSSWHYGPHVHVSLWERPNMSYSQTIDFELYVGEPDPPPTPKRKKVNMTVHAAWRDDVGSIAVQYQPRGPLTLLPDPAMWAGIQAATGAEASQVSSLQPLTDYYGTLPYGAAGMEHPTGMALVREAGGAGGLYLLAGSSLIPTTAETTKANLEGRVPELTLDTAEVQSMLRTIGPDPAKRDRSRRSHSHSLSTQAWVGVELLGLIALVEVVRFVVEHIAPG